MPTVRAPPATVSNSLTEARKVGLGSAVAPASPPNSTMLPNNGENVSEDSCVFLVDERRQSDNSQPSVLVPFDLLTGSASIPCGGDTLVTSPTVTFAVKADSWWSTRTRLEKCLICVLFAMLFFLVALLLVLLTNGTLRGRNVISYPAAILNDTLSICTTKGCVEAATNLLMAIDSTQDPCENFYEYACGQWNKHFFIPEDMSGYGTFALVRDRVRRQLKSLLDENSHGNSVAISMAKSMYKTCMNVTAINAMKSEKMIDVLKSFGGWPVLESNWRGENVDLTEVIGKMRGYYSLDVFVSLYVYADAKNTTQNILTIHQGSLGLGGSTRDYYLNDTLYGSQMIAYKRYFQRIVELIATDMGMAYTKEMEVEVNQTLNFEKTYAGITSPDDQRRNHSLLYNRWTLGQLKEKMPAIKWDRFFQLVMPQQVLEVIDDNMNLIITDPLYIAEINKLLLETDKRVLINYLLWRLSKVYTSMLDERYDEAYQDFVFVMLGRQSRPARWKTCVPVVVNWMEMAAGALYVERHFNQKDKEEAVALIDHLRLAFTELVKKLDWMDEETKKYAIEKAEEMINHIGYPEFINNSTLLDSYYEGLSLNENDTYFESSRKASNWLHRKEMLELLKPFNRDRFDTSPAVVNAFYSPEKNVITFPAGILQPPFFNGEYLKAINYGSIGAVIGHEITHGFDDQGSQYDKNGNLKDWWTPMAFERFRERTTCIIEQYNNYTVPDINIKVNGRLTQGENIADNAGVKEAYLAYRNYIVNSGKEEPRLPGLVNMTNDQIFFLSYANFWCGHKKPAASLQQVLTDPHSPEMFRVIGVLSNLDEFAKTFNCKPGSQMNPLPSDRRKCAAKVVLATIHLLRFDGQPFLDIGFVFWDVGLVLPQREALGGAVAFSIPFKGPTLTAVVDANSSLSLPFLNIYRKLQSRYIPIIVAHPFCRPAKFLTRLQAARRRLHPGSLASSDQCYQKPASLLPSFAVFAMMIQWRRIAGAVTLHWTEMTSESNFPKQFISDILVH
uniref:Peptidase M13 N-terminal domain-containing protein n=1 Tax=Trichuris muris TaxID=70415 RepID=A0A5S6Q7J6_TRIMR